MQDHHYTRGASKTAVYRHGLFRRADNALVGAVMWLPPTKVAAQSVDRARWQQVIALSRMAVAPGEPKNACSFMLGASLRAIKADARFASFVTYADEAEGHDGGVYRACGWQEIGRSGAYLKWLDPTTGRTVAALATKTRSTADMLAHGYVKAGVHGKRKFVLYHGDYLRVRLLRLSAAAQRATLAR